MDLGTNKPLLMNAFYDIIRLLVLQIVTQFLFSLTNTSVTFLNPVFIQSTVFLCIGLVIYWFIIYDNIHMEKFVSLFMKDEKDIKGE